MRVAASVVLWLLALSSSLVAATNYAVPIGLSIVCALGFFALAVPKWSNYSAPLKSVVALASGVMLLVLADDVRRIVSGLTRYLAGVVTNWE